MGEIETLSVMLKFNVPDNPARLPGPKGVVSPKYLPGGLGARKVPIRLSVSDLSPDVTPALKSMFAAIGACGGSNFNDPAAAQADISRGPC